MPFKCMSKLFLRCYHLHGLPCLCNILLMHPWFNGKTHSTTTKLMSRQAVSQVRLRLVLLSVLVCCPVEL